MTDATRATPRIAGTVRAEGGKGVVRMDCRYDTDIADLWSALTDPARLPRWIAEVQGDLRVGGEFHAKFTSSWEGPGRVDICEPPTRLLLTMQPGSEESTVIEAVLSPEGDHTRIVIEERGLPLANVADHGAGWQAHVEDLGAHLSGATPADWQARWSELLPAYRNQAAGIG